MSESKARDVVAVRESGGLAGAERVAQGAQHACLSDPWLAGDNGVFSLVHAGHELVDAASWRTSAAPKLPTTLPHRLPVGLAVVSDAAAAGVSRVLSEKEGAGDDPAL